MTSLPHEELQALLGVYAVDAIDDPEERAAVEEHLRSCDACRDEVDGHLDVLSRLGAAAAPVGDDAWAALSAAIAAEERPAGAEQTGATVLPFRPRRRARLLALAAPAAAAAAAVLITLGVSGEGDGLGTPVADAAMKPMSRSASVAGTVSLYRTSSPDGVVVIDLKNIPPAPSGHHYEVWVLRPGDEEMEAIGAFTPAKGTVRLRLPLPGAGDYVAVDISVEESGGSPEHSGTSIARALLS